MNNKKLLEERLSQIAKSLDSVEEFIDGLDIPVPEYAKKVIKKTIYSKEITEIVDGINEKRPPRLALIGRSGVGKSSLINALTGSYLAETSAVNVGTVDADLFQYKKDGEVIFEIIDTRGFKEDIQATDSTAEEDLVQAIEDFEPDAFLMINSSDRTTLREDTILLKNLSDKIKIEIPLITVISRVDQLDPARIKDPANYTEKKKANIQAKVEQAETVLKEVGILNSVVIPVSAYIEWNHESPETLTEEEQAALEIEFDGRYNIDALIEYLEENINFRAAVYMMLNYRIDKAIKKISNRIVKALSTASAAVAITPIPASDAIILIPIQILQVNLIAYLNGIKLDAKAAREFIVSLGGVALFGLGLRFVAQQGSKLFNVVAPAVGSAISSGIAYSGTYAVGQAAIAYYVEGKSEEETKNEMKKYENAGNNNEDHIEIEIKEKEKIKMDEKDVKEDMEINNDNQNKVKGFFNRFTRKKDDNEEDEQEYESDVIEEIEKDNDDINEEKEDAKFFDDAQSKVKGYFKGFGSKEDNDTKKID